MTIWTAAWSTKLPPGHTRVRISRGGPRWLPAGSYKSYSALFPGKWFKTASPHNAILANPTMLCFEAAKTYKPVIATAIDTLTCCGCDSLGIRVEEVGHPDPSRFPYLRGQHVTPPSYVRREPVEQLCLFEV
jgi:hypothetical protein